MAEEPRNLEQLLDRFCSAVGGHEKVTVRSIVEEIGTRSFGPLLLFAGVVLASPLSGIPGIPTTMGALVLLISLQLLFRRDHFWLPRWMLDRSIGRTKVERAVKLLRPPARFIDRFLRPRLPVLIRGASEYVVAAICGLIALGVPFMEVVPFSATLAGVAVSIFGLSIVARDGALAIAAFAVTAGTLALVLVHLL